MKNCTGAIPVFAFSVLLLPCISVFGQKIQLPSRSVLHAQAMAESLVPIRPGVPGRSAFWNAHARRFIFAPAFDMPPLDKAVHYRFTTISEVDNKSYVFESLHPWDSLTPSWSELPVGYATLRVEGVSALGHDTIGLSGERRFYRAAVYNGPYHGRVLSYQESGRRALEYLLQSPILQHWKTDGVPYPKYGLYCYPSKMFPSVMKTMHRYSQLTTDPQAKEDALRLSPHRSALGWHMAAPIGAAEQSQLTHSTNTTYSIFN